MIIVLFSMCFDQKGMDGMKPGTKAPVIPLLLVSSLMAPALTGAQTDFEFWPGTQYDPAVPTFAQVLGHGPGERITAYEGLIGYLPRSMPEKRLRRFYEQDTNSLKLP